MKAKNFISIALFLVIINFFKSQEISTDKGYTFRKVDKFVDNTALSDQKTDNDLYIKVNNQYYKRVLDRPYSVLDFGAIGDGISDDYGAIQKALDFVTKTANKTLLFPDNYIFNLKGQTLNINIAGVTLDFQGGRIKNGRLVGNATILRADRLQIFEKDLTLTGSFVSSTAVAYPEWYGTVANEKNSVDLVDALRQLDSFFSDISLGEGTYYTKKGEYTAKGIRGISMAKTTIIYETDKSNTFLFSLGMAGGALDKRNYDYNYLKDVTMVISPINKRLTTNSVLIVGAAHKASISNVKCIQNSKLQQITKTELQQVVETPSLSKIANVGIEFRGDSELTNLSNIFILSDIGIKFSRYTDFVQVMDLTTWIGTYGLASVYFASEATSSSNILFTGSQSWCQGLYGLYTEKALKSPTYTNVKFENVRVEQLTSDIRKQGKLAGANFWIGDNNEYIANLTLENVMLAGTSNGIHIGETHYGKVMLDNISTFSDQSVKKDFALDTVHKNKDSPLIIYLRNVMLYPDAESHFTNGSVIYNSYVPSNASSNLFIDNIITSKTTSVKSYGLTKSAENRMQQIAIPSNNTDFISLDNFNLKNSNHSAIRYRVNLYSNSYYESLEFVLLKNSGIQLLTVPTEKSLLRVADDIAMNKMNLVKDKDSGLIFIYNRLGEKCILDIQIIIIDTDS